MSGETLKCYNPRLAFVNPDGGRPIFTKYRWSHFVHEATGFKPPTFEKIRSQYPSLFGKPLKMPCGKCEACRLEQARERAVRCMHEFKSSGSVGAFLTLTYAESPPDGSYRERDVVLFVKKLRKALGGKKIKTFGCAEYGDKGGRPHYHLLVFGFDFPDRYYWRGSSEHGSGHVSYRSPLLEELWTLGHSELGSLTYNSASYVARYTQKKCKKKVDNGLLPEKAVCVSRRPGIGAKYFEQYKDDFYNIDAVIVNPGDAPQGIPRYYDRLLERDDPERFAQIKLDRELKRPQNEPENSPDRMSVRKRVHQETIKRLRRSL